jgi:hypothetical protein
MDIESKIPPDEPSTVFGMIALALVAVDLGAMLVAEVLAMPAFRSSPLSDRVSDFIFDYGGILALVGLILALVAIGLGGRGRRMGYWAVGMLVVCIVLMFA